MDIKEARKIIDDIDEEILKLLERRMEAVGRIGEFKAQNGMAILDSSREEEKMRAISHCSTPDFGQYNRDVFAKIMEGSRNYQQRVIEEGQESNRQGSAVYGLLGRSLGHSLSPKIHRLLGGYQYNLFEVEPEKLDEFFERADFKAINVTTPYKKEVSRYCQSLSREAIRTGSINTVVKNNDGTLTGYNTDYYGFGKMLREALGCLAQGEIQKLKEKKVLVLGDGGVAPTIRALLEDEGWDKIITISRRGPNNYDNLQIHADGGMIVNCTTVGMYPDCEKGVVSLKDFPQCKVVLDLIYNPLNTKLVVEALEEGHGKGGIIGQGGLKMLVFQAQEAVRLFTGKDISDERTLEVYDQIKSEVQNIAIIGMPGCGKSTMAEAMARLTGKAFVDIDEEILKAFGTTPEEIIETKGEEAFRQMESQILAKVCKEHNQIIATGGGVVVKPENRALIKQNSIVIYLKRPLEALATEGRPISKERGVAEVFAEREARYLSWSDYQIEVTKELEPV